MTVCRTIAEVESSADADSAGEPPLSQETADRIAAILMTCRWARPASREADGARCRACTSG